MKRAKPDAKSDDFGAVWTLPGEQAAPGRLRCEYEIRMQMVGGALWTLSDPVVRLRAEAEKKRKKTRADWYSRFGSTRCGSRGPSRAFQSLEEPYATDRWKKRLHYCLQSNSEPRATATK